MEGTTINATKATDVDAITHIGTQFNAYTHDDHFPLPVTTISCPYGRVRVRVRVRIRVRVRVRVRRCPAFPLTPQPLLRKIDIFS